jgi:hypothetical protein
MTISWRMAPVECVELRESIDFWRERRAGFDLTPVVPPAEASGYPTTLAGEALLSMPATLATAAAAMLPESGLVDGQMAFEINRPGTLDGLAGWFVAELSPGVTFTNGPEVERINRRQVVLPVQPVRVQQGDRVCARVRFRPATLMVDWQVAVADASGRERMRVRRATFQGMLIAPEDLATRTPSARPALSRRGIARRMALALCDGARTIEQIEAELRDAFPDVLPSDEEAAAFVSEVIGSDLA